MHPEWRMVWFPLIAVIEIPLMAMALELFIRQFDKSITESMPVSASTPNLSAGEVK